MPLVNRIKNNKPLTYPQLDGNFDFVTLNLSGSLIKITGSVIQISGSIVGDNNLLIPNSSGITEDVTLKNPTITGSVIVPNVFEANESTKIVNITGSLTVSGSNTLRNYGPTEFSDGYYLPWKTSHPHLVNEVSSGSVLIASRQGESTGHYSFVMNGQAGRGFNFSFIKDSYAGSSSISSDISLYCHLHNADYASSRGSIGSHIHSTFHGYDRKGKYNHIHGGNYLNIVSSSYCHGFGGGDFVTLGKSVASYAHNSILDSAIGTGSYFINSRITVFTGDFNHIRQSYLYPLETNYSNLFGINYVRTEIHPHYRHLIHYSFGTGSHIVEQENPDITAPSSGIIRIFDTPTTASRNYSHLVGSFLASSVDYQNIIGRVNVHSTDEKELFIIGDGSLISTSSYSGYSTDIHITGKNEHNLFSAISGSGVRVTGSFDVNGDYLVNGIPFVGSLQEVTTAGNSTTSSVIIGTGTATNLLAVAKGFRTRAIGQYSHAEGGYTTAIGIGSHAEGYPHNKLPHLLGGSISHGNYSHAEGWKGQSHGNSSHAEGYGSHAWAEYSHTEGVFTQTYGAISSHAEGLGSAIGNNLQGSHAEGYYTDVNGFNSHAEGNRTTAIGDVSHTEGYFTTTTGIYAHAEGNSSRAIGEASHAEGKSIISLADFQHVQGQWNIESSNNKDLMIIGDGTSNSNRHNLFKVVSGSGIQIIGSVDITGGYLVTSSILSIPIFTDSLLTTSSFNTYTGSTISTFEGTSSYALTASYVSGGFNVSSSHAIMADTASHLLGTVTSASYALTASHATKNTVTASYLNTLTQDVTILGQVNLSGSLIPYAAGFGSGTSSFSLGSSTNSWKDLWVANKSIHFVEDSSTYYTLNVDTNNGTPTLSIEGNTAALVNTTGSQNITASYALTASIDLKGNQTLQVITSLGNATTSSIVLGTGEAIGNSSFVEGASSTAIGDYSHTEGVFNTAKGAYSHIEGSHNIAGGNYQRVVGQFNEETTDTGAFIVGGGIVGNVNTMTVTDSVNITGSLEIENNNGTSYLTPPIITIDPTTSSPYNTTNVPIAATVFYSSHMYVKVAQPSNWTRVT